MELKPLTTRSARTREGKIRLYAGPQFVRPDGRTWGLLDEIVWISQQEDQFQVRCGREWISIGPVEPIRGLVRMERGKRRCGWLLDAAAAPEEISFRVEHSAGVRRVANGWQIAAPDEVEVGLFVDDWLRQKELECRLGDREVRLSLGAIKASRAEVLARLPAEHREGWRVGDGLIDLDPTTQLGVEDWTVASVFKIQSDPVPAEREVWDAVRGLADADAVGQVAGLVLRAGRIGVTTVSFLRAAFKFDTSGYAAGHVAAATLYMRFYSGAPLGATSDQAHVSRVTTFNSGSFVVSDYGKVKDDGAGGGYDNAPIGYMSAVADGEWASRAIPVGQYGSEAEYGLGAGMDYDVEDDYDGVTDFRTIEFYSGGGDGPYLELTLTGAPMPILSSGKTQGAL